MSAGRGARRTHLVPGLSIVVGLALLVIGVRFLAVPRSAAWLFGIADAPGPFDLHYVVGLRDLWLGLLLVAFAALREWRAAALWLAFGALVCAGDGWIAAASSGRVASVAFHLASGALFAMLGAACWRRARRSAG